MSNLSIILRTPGLGVAALVMMLIGAFSGSIFPFQSVIGIEEIGLSEPTFATLMVLASASGVIAAVFLGILSDRFANRRVLAIATSACGTLGLGLMLIAPRPVSFIICHGIAVPIAMAMMGQIFALGRLALSDQPDRRVIVLSWIRACMSGAYLAAMLVWNWYFRLGGVLMGVYVGAFAISLCMTVALIIGWPRQGRAKWADVPSGLNFRQAFKEILRGAVVIRLLCMGAMTSVISLFMTLLPLIFLTTPNRTTGDAALYFGLVAGWEVPVMLTMHLWGLRIRRSMLMAMGGLFYALNIIALQIMAASPMVWALSFVGGASGAVFMGLQISYLQDLLNGRPGTAGALLALQKLIGDLAGALAFLVGTTLGGYGAVALIGGAIGCIGAIGLMMVDRRGEPIALAGA